jgi:hypothetical protein
MAHKPRDLPARQQGELHRLMRPPATLATAKALRWREDFHAFYDHDPSYAPKYLRRWCSGAKRSRLQPLKDFVTLVERHWDGIIALARAGEAPEVVLEATYGWYWAAGTLAPRAGRGRAPGTPAGSQGVLLPAGQKR